MARRTKSEIEAAAASDSEGEKKFPLRKMAETSLKLFGVPSSTFAGAVADLEDGSYTKSEIAAKIEEWKKREAK